MHYGNIFHVAVALCIFSSIASISALIGVIKVISKMKSINYNKINLK